MQRASGPPPKPSALRVIEGGGKMRGRYAARAKREPKPTIGLREPPKAMNADQLAIWRRLEEDSPDGLLTRVDADLFANYVIALAVRDTALERFNATGGQVLVKSSEHAGYSVNPYLKEFRRVCELLRPMQQELGYTPASRTRIAVQGADEDEDPLTRFLPGTSPAKKGTPRT